MHSLLTVIELVEAYVQKSEFNRKLSQDAPVDKREFTAERLYKSQSATRGTAAGARGHAKFFHHFARVVIVRKDHLLEGICHRPCETAKYGRSAVELKTIALERVGAAARDGVALAHGDFQSVLRARGHRTTWFEHDEA